MNLKRNLAAIAALPLVLSACGDDTSSDSSAPVGAGNDDPAVQQAVADYRSYLEEQVDELVARTTTFTDAVRAGDVTAAQAAYAPSREPWERIEPIAGLVEELDGAIDARVDDFADESDPEFTGWHRLEYLLFVEETTAGAETFADDLDENLAVLDEQVSEIELPPATLAIGAAELVEEVSAGKITGEEDRYSKTDLSDFNANLEGSKELVADFAPALTEKDPELLEAIESGFAELDATLEPLRDGGGWVPYCVEDDEFPSDLCPAEPTVSQATVDELKAELASLSEDISQVAGTLELA